MTHKRNTVPMMFSPRCGAKTRNGTPCASPAVRGKKRCRMHGGAKGSGAPRGNKNAFVDGSYTREQIEEYREVGRCIRQMKDFLRRFEASKD
jgi:hypothetical protein